MGWATGFQVGWGAGQDIAAGLAVKREKKRAGKLLEEFKAQLEEYQLSDNELTYYEKVQLSFLANQIGSTYAKSYDELTASQASYDKEKMVQEYQSLSKKNELFATLIKEIKDNKYLSQADLSALDEMTGLPLSKLWNKETMDGIRNEETKQQTLDNVFGVAKELPTEYTMPYMVGQGVEGLTGLQPTASTKAAGISDYNSAANYLKNYANSKMSDADFYKVRDGMATKFGLDLSGMTRESLREAIKPETESAFEERLRIAEEGGATPEELYNMRIGKSNTTTAGKETTAEDVIAGKLSIIPSSIDLTLGEPTDEEKTIILTNYNRIKGTLTPEVQSQVEVYLQQLGIDLNPPATPIPEPTPEPEVKQPGLFQKIKKWATAPLLDVTQPLKANKDYTKMSEEELYNLAMAGDTLAYAEAKKRGLIK